MSLVAYAASSSDEDSDCAEDGREQTKAEILLPSVRNGHISDDEDDDFAPVEARLEDIAERSAFTLSLPKPKHADGANVDVDDIAPAFGKLPMPKSAQATEAEEDDDEFLHKKATPLATDEKPMPKGPVRITIPALKDFSDVDKELAGKAKSGPVKHSHSSGLLSLLPQAKSEQNFAKGGIIERKADTRFKENPTTSTATAPSKPPAFVPDTVKHRRPAHNTEGVDGIATSTVKTKKTEMARAKTSLVDCSDSDGSDDDNDGGGDFFSLNADDKLPEISCNEINALVAKKAAQIANATTKYLNAEKEKVESNLTEVAQTSNEEELRLAQKRYHEQRLESEAVQALVGGGKAKRRRKQAELIEVMDISSDQVLPNREEWMRNALAGATGYQPTGVLVDEEPAAGTRRKHQITYLAHKAKANEAELQAMWSANRQTRRATQSKYGF